MEKQEPAKFLASSSYDYTHPYPQNYDQSRAYATDTLASNYASSLPPYYSSPQATGFQYQGNYFCDPSASYDDKYGSKRRRSVDPRIIDLLEPLRKLYTERKEMFGTIFSGVLDELPELFKKVNSLVTEAKASQRRHRTMQRSLSLGSAPANERFKIRILDAAAGISINGAQQDGKGDDDPNKQGSNQGGGDGTKSSDSTCTTSSQ